MKGVITITEEKDILNNTSMTFEERKKDLLKQTEYEEEKKERDKRNHNFVQIYRDHMTELRWLMINHPLASSVLFYILEKMDGKNVLACSYKVLEEYFNKSNSTLHRAVKILKENGFLTVAKMGTSNVYIVNTDIAWTSYEDQKSQSNSMYAEFDGKILISKKENEDYVKNQISIKTVDSLK